MGAAHDIQGGVCVVCGMPSSTVQWKKMAVFGCPGVRWLRVAELADYPYLATATTLRSLKHKPAATQSPAACYYSQNAEAYRLLYDVREAVPLRPTSAKQRAILDRARRLAQAAVTCSWCGLRVRRKDELQQVSDGRRLCADCVQRWDISAGVRAMLETPERYVILDTETTGLDASDGAEIVELAVLGLDSTLRLDTLIRPRAPVPPDSFIAFYGITDEVVHDAPTFAEVYPQLVAALKGKTVLIYNRDFDLSMVAAECERLEVPSPLKRRTSSCVMDLYSEWVGEWSSYWGNYRWQSLPGGGHRALDDCSAVLDLLREMAAAVPDPDA